MTDHQILGLMAQTMGDIARQVAASSKELAELVRVEGEKIRDELKAS